MSFILRHPRWHAVLDHEFVSNADDLFVCMPKVARECLLARLSPLERCKRAGEFCWIAEIRQCPQTQDSSACGESNVDSDWGFQEANLQESRCRNCNGENVTAQSLR